MYLLAVLLPPVAVLICGKPIQALINVVLCLIFYVPGMIHAIMVVNEYKADKRAERLAKMQYISHGYSEKSRLRANFGALRRVL